MEGKPSSSNIFFIYTYIYFYKLFFSSCTVIDQKPLTIQLPVNVPFHKYMEKQTHKDVSLRSKICPPTTFKLLKPDNSFLPVLTPCGHKSTAQTHHPNDTAEINSHFLFSSIPQEGMPAGGCMTDFTYNA